MALSSELISQFVKSTKDDKKVPNESTVYGTVKVYDDEVYVKFDGSDLLTPVSTTTNVSTDERVAVIVKDHTATIIGNISSPSAKKEDVDKVAVGARNLIRNSHNLIYEHYYFDDSTDAGAVLGSGVLGVMVLGTN